MQLVTEYISRGDLALRNLIMTGEAANMAGCDRRTFITWAVKLKVKPIDTLAGGKLVYSRHDVERVVKAYKAHLEQKEKEK